MGHGTNGPRPFTQRRASTIFLRVPAVDWPAVTRGIKTEFRQGGAGAHMAQLWLVECPTPVVAWTLARGRYRAQLMWLEERWQEPVGAISEESLRREGFATLKDFRHYWMRDRTYKRFQPTRNVLCYRLRPLRDGDLDGAADALLRHLYGEFIDGPVEAAA